MAVKSGDDVIVLDRCGAKRADGPGAFKPKIYYNGELTAGTRVVKKNDDGYKVSFLVNYMSRCLLFGQCCLFIFSL